MENNIVVIDTTQLAAIIREAVKTEVQTTVTEIIKSQNKALWTVNDVAEKLQMSVRTVRKYTYSGIIPSYNIGAAETRSVRYNPIEVLSAWKSVDYT